VDGVTDAARSYPLFTIDDARAWLARCPDARIVLTVQGTGTFVREGRRRHPRRHGRRHVRRAGGGGDSRPAPRSLSTLNEMANDGAVVVVSHALAKALATNDDLAPVVGRELRLGDKPQTIVGVLTSFPGERGFRVLAPLPSSQAAMVAAASPRALTMLIQAARIEDVEPTRAAVEAWTDASHPRVACRTAGDGAGAG
jgi:hypothetical protein